VIRGEANVQDGIVRTECELLGNRLIVEEAGGCELHGGLFDSGEIGKCAIQNGAPAMRFPRAGDSGRKLVEHALEGVQGPVQMALFDHERRREANHGVVRVLREDAGSDQSFRNRASPDPNGIEIDAAPESFAAHLANRRASDAAQAGE